MGQYPQRALAKSTRADRVPARGGARRVAPAWRPGARCGRLRDAARRWERAPLHGACRGGSRAPRRPRSRRVEPARRVRWVARTHASTASGRDEHRRGDRFRPGSVPDHASVRTGWASWTWPIFATPPRARPGYQAKKPRNIENRGRRRSRATAPVPWAPSRAGRGRRGRSRAGRAAAPSRSSARRRAAREPAALRVAEPAQQPREQSKSAPACPPAPGWRRRHTRHQACGGGGPERPWGPLAGAGTTATRRSRPAGSPYDDACADGSRPSASDVPEREADDHTERLRSLSSPPLGGWSGLGGADRDEIRSSASSPAIAARPNATSQRVEAVERELGRREREREAEDAEGCRAAGRPRRCVRRPCPAPACLCSEGAGVIGDGQ